MKQETKDAASPEIERVRRRIERWRETRTKGGPMPETLWAAAAGLARLHGLYPMSRALGVDYGALRRRVNEGPREDGGGEPQGGAMVQACGFVEVKATHLVEPRSLPTQTVIELWGADGTRMTMTVRSHDAVDVVGLATAFFGRGA